tara:strand:- start:185 stop:1141 length:957 start_codon:yes stop_codon:yes gene_type:complete
MSVAICEHVDPYLVYKAERSPWPGVNQRLYGRNVGHKSDLGSSSQVKLACSPLVTKLVAIKQEKLNTLEKSIECILDESTVALLGHGSELDSDSSGDPLLASITPHLKGCMGCQKMALLMTGSIWMLDLKTTISVERSDLHWLDFEKRKYSLAILQHVFMPIRVVGIVPAGDETLTSLAFGRLDIVPFPTGPTPLHSALYLAYLKTTPQATGKTTKSDKVLAANVGWSTVALIKNVGNLHKAKKCVTEILNLWYPENKEAAQKREMEFIEAIAPDTKKQVIWCHKLMQNTELLLKTISFKYENVVSFNVTNSDLYTVQ